MRFARLIIPHLSLPSVCCIRLDACSSCETILPPRVCRRSSCDALPPTSGNKWQVHSRQPRASPVQHPTCAHEGTAMTYVSRLPALVRLQGCNPFAISANKTCSEMPKIASSELRWLAAPLPSGCGQFSLLLRHTGTVVVARKALACGVTSASSVSIQNKCNRFTWKAGRCGIQRKGARVPRCRTSDHSSEISNTLLWHIVKSTRIGVAFAISQSARVHLGKSLS